MGTNARSSAAVIGKVLIAAIALLIVGIPAVEAQVFSLGNVVSDRTGNPDGFFCQDRPFRGLPFSWGGTNYVYVHTGVDVAVYKLDDPGNREITDAGLGAGLNCQGWWQGQQGEVAEIQAQPVEALNAVEHSEPFSDSEIKITAETLGVDGISGISICDECRYGLVRKGSEVAGLDLGQPSSSSQPDVIDRFIISGDFHVTYKYGGTQYVIGTRGPGSCVDIGDQIVSDIGVWTLPSLTQYRCLPDDFPLPVGESISVTGDGDAGFIVFEIDDYQAVVAQIKNGVPEVVGSPMAFRGANAMSVDSSNYPGYGAHLLLVDQRGGNNSATIYRVGYSGGNVSVSHLLSDDISTFGWSIGSLTVDEPDGEGYVFLSSSSPPHRAQRGLFQLSGLNGGSPSGTIVDEAYWNDSNSDFNQAVINPTVGKDLGATFNRNGDGLLLFRYYSIINMKYNGPAEPDPGISIDNSGTIYPGTLVELRNSSTNWTTARGSVTRGSSLTDPEVHSSGTFSASLSTFNWATSHLDFDCSTNNYYAHVQIDGASGPHDSQQIPFVCDPQVDFTAPANALTNSTPTLSASAPGYVLNSPDNDYNWDIWYPGSSTSGPPDDDTQTGTSLNQTLNLAGEWNFRLNVTYDHIVDWNGPDPIYYIDSSSIKTIDVSGLAPAIGFSPSSPTLQTGITLNANGSEAAVGLTNGTYAYTVDDVSVSGCSGALSWNGPNVEIPNCVVPSDNIVADQQQTAKLTLNADGETTKVASTTFQVRSYEFDFSISDANPDRGQEVTFILTQGSPDDLDRWEFGSAGTSCDGYTSFDCTFNPAFCNSVKWTFANSGTVDVRLIDSNDAVVASKTVNVSSSGSCPVDTCTSYSLSPTRNWNVGPSGGSYSVTVTGSPSGCQPSWSASVTSGGSWINITSQTSNRVNYSCGSYSVVDGSRSGQLQIAGRGFEVLQSGPGGGGPSDFDFSISDSNPDMGEEVTFTLTQGTATDVGRWEFGSQSLKDGENCDGETDWVCNGSAIFCPKVDWAFAKSGNHEVRLYDMDDRLVASKSVTVTTSGFCPGNPPQDPCEFTATMTPSDGEFSHSGGDGTISVTASDSECSWSVETHWLFEDWVKLNPPLSKTGSDQATFEILLNEDELERDAPITVRGDDGFYKTFDIVQNGKPKEPAKFSVATVARTKGVGNTDWSTRMIILNPEDYILPILVRFVILNLEAEDLITSYEIPRFELQPKTTYFVDDIVSVVAGNLEGKDVKGAMQFEVLDEIEGFPVITSRTATKAPEGSYGQFIPAVPMLHSGTEDLVLVGLADNEEYRSNIGVTNMEEFVVNVVLTAVDADGDPIGSPATVGVPKLANNQMSVRQLFPEFTDTEGFSVRAETAGADVTVYGTMMHAVTSDPIYIRSEPSTSARQIIPNLAHNRGQNFSTWSSDISLYNPNPVAINLTLDYIPDPADGFWWPSKRINARLDGYQTRVLRDVVREFLSNDDEESKGYMIVEMNESGLEPPVIVGRTYTEDGEKLYGQGLRVISEDEMLGEDDVAWIAGVEDSVDFRTNFSILNLGAEEARVELRFYDEMGNLREGAKTLTLPGSGEFLQFEFFKALPQLEPGIMRGSLEILVLEGDKIFPYITIMDNFSNDPVFVTGLEVVP